MLTPFLAETKADDRDSSLLVVVFDTNPSQRFIRDNPQSLTQCMDSVVAFSNAHVMQRANNQLVVMACHHHATWVDEEKDLPGRNSWPTKNCFELFQRVPVPVAGQTARDPTDRRPVRDVHDDREDGEGAAGDPDQQCHKDNGANGIAAGRLHCHGPVSHKSGMWSI